MRGIVSRFGRSIAYVLRDQSSARKVAWGIAFGLVIGLLPKLNVVTLLLVLVGICLPINLSAAILSVFVFSLVSTLTGVVAHDLGQFVLNIGGVRELTTWVSQQPLVAWASLTNPNVIGSLILSGILFVPAYFISRKVMRHFGDRITVYLSDFWVFRVVFQAE